MSEKSNTLFLNYNCLNNKKVNGWQRKHTKGIITYLISLFLKDQAWCSNNTYCKSCVTEVENINTEIKRTSPIPKGDLQMMIKEQRGFNN